ncbi:MAG TPA: FliH/SctL family protein [Terracidiphilus sp.]|jgi:flagellar assembly protein FliH
MAAEVQVNSGQTIEIFRYVAGPEPPIISWDAWGIPVLNENVPLSVSPVASDPQEQPALVEDHRKCAERLSEEVRRSFESGRECGEQQGRTAEREAQSAAAIARDSACRAETVRMLEKFSQERSRYFEAVEPEVVKLALSVAARILRREAQMDPLLLTGAVRVALGQLSASTEVKVRVPPAELELWTDTIALLPRLAIKPTVQPGEGMRLGECVIETGMGTVDLGVRAQLSEIERGFFDRAGHRPPADTDRASQSPAEDAL